MSKAALARSLGISRSSLYYTPTQEAKDQLLKGHILDTLTKHPGYGYRRVALHLARNEKPIQRVMRKYGIQPRIQPKRRKQGTKAEDSGIPNRTRGISPIAPNVVWAGDFTHLVFFGRHIYLATVLDTYTKEIIAWQLGLHHTAQLIIDVLEEAKRKCGTPLIFHTDQGSEYTSGVCVEWLIRNNVHPSNSPKGKPWNNGAQESFYNTFKREFGTLDPYFTLDALVEAIGRYIHYYNAERIHSKLKMPPREFCEKEVLKYPKR